MFCQKIQAKFSVTESVSYGYAHSYQMNLCTVIMNSKSSALRYTKPVDKQNYLRCTCTTLQQP